VTGLTIECILVESESQGGNVMGIGDAIRKTFDTVTEVGSALVKLENAKKEASRLLGMSKPVARRELKSLSQTLDSDEWRLLLSQLDDIARSDSGRRADMAAELAEYGESL
jgi:hypothetical protein